MSKEVKEGTWESRGAQKQGESMACEISQPKVTCCENRPLVAKWFRSWETSTPWNPPFRSQDTIWKGVSQLWNHPLAHKCHFKASYTHFAAAKWLQNLHILKSFSAHTMSWHVAAVPPFWQLLDTFRSLYEVHFMHTIYSLKYWEVRSP